MTNAEQGHGHIDASAVWQAISSLQRVLGRMEGKMDALEAGQRDLAQRTEASIDRLERRIDQSGQRIDLLGQRIDRFTLAFIGSSAVLAAAMIGAIFASRFIG